MKIGDTVNERLIIERKDNGNYVAQCLLCGRTANGRPNHLQKTSCFCQRSKKTKATCLERYGVNCPAKSSAVQEKSKRTNLERYGTERPTQNDAVKAKVRQTFQDRYGVSNPMQSETTKEKAKQTNLERYGRENPMQSETVKEKARQAWQQNYGCDHPMQSESTKEKVKQTSLERYGCENPMQSETVQEKARQSWQQKYGCDHPMQSESTKEKAKQTNLERFGCENPMQSEVVKEKARQTWQQNYGCEHPMLSEAVQEKVRQTFQDRYSVDTLMQSESFKEKTKNTNIKRYGCENPMQSEVVKEKARQTWQQNYGCDHPMQSESTKEKAKQTNVERYGCENPMQSETVQEKARQTCRKHYGVDNSMLSEVVQEKALHTRLKNSKENGFRSKGEMALNDWLNSLGITTRHGHFGKHEVDILIDDKKIGIEFNGLYWHSEAQKEHNYHLEKTIAISQNGYNLIHIWEHLWLTRNEQVKNFLKSKLGLNSNRVGVRKCVVAEVPKKEALEFIEKYHIQGSGKQSCLAIGAYFNGELIAVASFAQHHRDNKKITLRRLVFKEDWTCSGFLGKVMKMAHEKFQCPIYSWVDCCWSTGESYLKAGFKKEAVLPPDYFYVRVNDTRKVVAKQAFRATETQTERERAAEAGLLRVYDCGKIRFVFC